MRNARVRLHVEQPLGAGQAVPLEGGQAHYLFNVMRLGPGDPVALFNGRDGEYAARIEQAGKRRGVLVCTAQSAPQSLPPDLWLVFAPVKKARTDFIVEKAVELGVRRIVPIRSDFTDSARFRADKQHAHAIEAAEQCGAVYVPEVAELQPLARLLDVWDTSRQLFYADEARAGRADALSGSPPGPAAMLIGPEGGFSAPERARLHAMQSVTPISLGPRILRAETAAIAALTLWQAALGDWT
ncbi:MAG TPA: 16S rRNA (uracil(1498)-N(3))-methyltransferase [Aliiroseovarius sp.]|nr:16S rRNA (uracil(1498)-N(3))-methyltransferase [Aliiroseovarius sp.]